MSLKRCKNFSEQEKELLIEIARKYSNILENKCCKAPSLADKAAAWASIAGQFNKQCTSGRREVFTLKNLYKNLKSKARKEVAEDSKVSYTKQPKITASELQLDIKKETLDIEDEQLTSSSLELREKIQTNVERNLNSFSDTFIPARHATITNTTEDDTPDDEDDLPATETENVGPETPADNTEEIIQELPREIRKKQKLANVKKDGDYYRKLYFYTKYKNALLEKNKLLLEIEIKRIELQSVTARLKI